MIRKCANVIIVISFIILYVALATGRLTPVATDTIPLEGDWYYYHEMALDVSKTYGACEEVNNPVYTQGFIDGATNGIGAMMEQMVITGNEENGYTVEVNGEQYYFEP